MEELSEEKYPFKCNSCPLKFSNMEGANIHFLDGHEKKKEVEIEELPQVVGQIFKAPSKIKKSGSSEKIISSFKCSICGASFLTKEKLNKHIAVIHMLKCDFCDAAFTSEMQLELHIMKVHEGKKPFKCSICKTAFVSKRKLNEHIGRIHNENRSPGLKQVQMKFQCIDCNVLFKHEYGLKEHQCRNGKMILHKCDFCDFKIPFLAVMYKHIDSLHPGKTAPKYTGVTTDTT